MFFRLAFAWNFPRVCCWVFLLWLNCKSEFQKKFSLLSWFFRMITAVSWIPKGAPKVMHDDAEPHSKEKINELSRMAPSKKVEFFSISCLYCTFSINHSLICGYMDIICYLSDMHGRSWKRDGAWNNSGEVAHTKAVAKSFGKPCSKSKYNSKHCNLIHLIVIVFHLSQSTEFDCSVYQQADRDSNW